MEGRISIRERLQKHSLSYVWLIAQLNTKGIKTDKTEMSSVVAGTRTGDKADSIIQTSNKIIDEYEKVFVHSD